MNTTLTPAEAVASGAQWLDELHPGWYRHISLKQLSLKNKVFCVCGQLQKVIGRSKPDLSPYDEFMMSYTEGAVDPYMDGLIIARFAASLGFAYHAETSGPFREEWWDGLHTEWCKVIESRLKMDALDEKAAEPQPKLEATPR